MDFNEKWSSYRQNVCKQDPGVILLNSMYTDLQKDHETTLYELMNWEERTRL